MPADGPRGRGLRQYHYALGAPKRVPMARQVLTEANVAHHGSRASRIAVAASLFSEAPAVPPGAHVTSSPPTACRALPHHSPGPHLTSGALGVPFSAGERRGRRTWLPRAWRLAQMIELPNNVMQLTKGGWMRMEASSSARSDRKSVV